MSRDPKNPENAAPADVKNAGAPTLQARARAPYHPPQLRRLGSVRDLTLGATGPMGDGMGGFMANM